MKSLRSVSVSSIVYSRGNVYVPILHIYSLVLVYVNVLYVLHNFLVSPQIVNPQILGLISQSQIRKFLKCASPQIANRKFQIRKMQKIIWSANRKSANRKSSNCHICWWSANQQCKFANLRMCALWNLFADRPSLMYRKKERKKEKL